MNQRTRIRRAQKGDDFRVHMNASTWNAFIDAAEAVSYNGDARGLPQTGVSQTDVVQSVLGAGGGVLKQVTSLFTSTGTPDEIAEEWLPWNPVFAGSDPTATDHGAFGVLLNEGIEGEAVSTVAGGVVSCMLHIEENGSWIQWADVDPADNSRLLATPSGSAQILWKNDGGVTLPDTVEAIVRIGVPGVRVLIGKANGELTPDATDNVVRVWSDASTDTQYDISGVKLDWLEQDLPISSGKEVAILWDTKVWRVLWAECEDPDPWPYPSSWNGDYSATGPPTP